MADARPANSRVLLVSANCESAGDTHASITAKHTHQVINNDWMDDWMDGLLDDRMIG